MNDGAILAGWLKKISGHVLFGMCFTVESAEGEPQKVGESARYRVGKFINYGGQAAVALVTPVTGDLVDQQFVARLEFSPRDDDEEKRRKNMLFLAHLSRTRPDRYPALIRVKESFQISIPVAQLTGYSAWSDARQVSGWVDVMEQGTPLRDWMASSRPNGCAPVEGIELVVPLLQTVGQLSADYDLVHRDIDEGNVLVAGDGTIRLTDWGIVRQRSGGNTDTYTNPTGKRWNLPPEARWDYSPKAEKPVSHAYDAWQCGRVVAYVFTGASPFTKDGVDKDVNHPRLEKLSPPIRAVVAGLCRCDRKSRLSTMEAAERLDNYRRTLELFQKRESARQRRAERMVKLMPLFMTALMFSSTLIYSTSGLLLLRPDSAAGVESFLSKMFTFSAFLALFYLIAGLLGFHVVRLLLWVVGILIALSTFWQGTESWSSNEGTIWSFPWYEVLPAGPAPPGFLVGWLSEIIEDLNLARGWVWTVGWVWTSVGLLLVAAPAFLETPRRWIKVTE